MRNQIEIDAAAEAVVNAGVVLDHNPYDSKAGDEYRDALLAYFNVVERALGRDPMRGPEGT